MLPNLIRPAFGATADSKSLAGILAEVKPIALKPPVLPFVKSRIGEGMIGAWGEVRVARPGSGLLPAFLESADKLAVVNIAVREPHVQIGVGRADTITWTSAGVAFGKGAKPEAWSAAVVSKLIKSIAADPQKASALMQLRSAFATAYPMFAATSKSALDKRIAAVHQRTSAGYAKSLCTTKTVTETVTREVIEFVEVWKSAEARYQECFDHETSGASGLACSLLPAGFARDVCAATACTAKGFVDIVVAIIETVVEITEEVVRTVVTCVAGVLPNPWTLIGRALPGLERPGTAATQFSLRDIQTALDFLEGAAGALGPFANCLLKGKWSLESVDTPIKMSDGNLAIPYGVRVCMSADCARSLTVGGVGSELVASWTAALTLLAALSPAFAAIAGPLGITVSAALAGLVAAIGVAGAAVAAIILAFIILALIYGTALVAQLTVAEALGAFADGEVCIVHPTFALAMDKMLTMGFVPAELVPPTVVG